MSAPEAASTSPAATPGSRTAGFVLGANWRRPEPTAPSPRLLDEDNPPPSGDLSQLNPANRLEQAPAIFQDIITHYVDPALRPRLREPGDNLRLIEDLGLDSLSMIEVMQRVEDLLQIRVSDEELRHFRTLGEVREFVVRHTWKTAVSAPRPETRGSRIISAATPEPDSGF